MSCSSDEAALHEALGSLISGKSRSDRATWQLAYQASPIYLQKLGLTECLKHVRVLHIAGTKGKGSTASFTASILKECGYSVGLFTSPHLCDVRERIRINGALVDKQLFQETFWHCFNLLKSATTPEIPMPAYFRFLTLLALKIFVQEGLDVIVLEVGIGGRLDSTNVIPSPVATAVTTLDYDHVELLGDTLTLIAREKAGIFRRDVPAFTCEQVPEAMASLEAVAQEVHCPLAVVPLLASAPPLGLPGDFQHKNAAIALALCTAFDKHISALPATTAAASACRSHAFASASERAEALARGELPAAYAAGLQNCTLPGRAQTVLLPAADLPCSPPTTRTTPSAAAPLHSDAVPPSDTSPEVAFFIDGAHTPESMLACMRWFSEASASDALARGAAGEPAAVDRVLIFNCQTTRQPEQLLRPFGSELDVNEGGGAPGAIHHAVFVPGQSVYTSVVPSEAAAVDVSWQNGAAAAWERLHTVRGDVGGAPVGAGGAACAGTRVAELGKCLGEGAEALSVRGSSSVHSSLQGVLARMRVRALSAPSHRLQVLVTGSLHLAGDVLRLLGRMPS